MRHRGHVIGRHEDRQLAKSRRAFIELCGEAAAPARAAAIAALPMKLWKDHAVYRVRCCGDFGRGPHDVWLPERVLWALAGFDPFLCVYHR